MLSIYNYENQKLAILKSSLQNNIIGEASNLKNEIEINGLKKLSFSVPYYISVDGAEEENHRIQYLIPEIQIKFTYKNVDDFYIVNKIDESHSDGKLFLNIECNHISTILNKKGLHKVFVDNIEDYTDTTNIYDGIGTAQQLLTLILNNTGWTVGNIDTFYEKGGAIEKIRSLKCEKKSTMEQLQMLAELFNGFLQFNGDKTVDFKSEIGLDNGVTFRYKYNIKSIQKNSEDTDLITRMYCEGAETDDGIVTIEEYTGTKENYIDNFQYYIESGLMSQVLQDKITVYNTNIKNINTSINTAISDVAFDSSEIFELEGQRDAKELQKQALETLIQELTDKIAVAIGTEKSDLEAEKSTTETTLATVNNDIAILNAQIAGYETDMGNHNTILADLVNQRKTLREQFENDMQNFLKVGFHNDSNYYDGQKLYDDSVDLLDELSMPRVSYSMDIIDLSDIDEYKLLQIDIGDIIGIHDERLKLKTKGRITKINKDFDNFWNTQIEIANFYTPFEELFDKLSESAEVVKTKQEAWDRSRKALDSNGNINQKMLQKAFNQNAFQLLSGTKNSVVQDDKGITITDLNNPNNILRMNAGIITLSEDGGTNWKVAMNAKGFNFSHALGGVLEIGKIFIAGGTNNSTFNWTENGLIAYNPLNENQWIKFDKSGIAGTLDGGETYEFSLTFAGLKIGKHSVEGLEDELSQITQDLSNVQENLNTFVTTTYANDISDLQNQIDGSITTWFYDGEPTLSNAPAVNWVSSSDKDKHLGDLYYDNLTGYAYRFRFTSVYEWFKIPDVDVAKALSDAAKAQDTADNKRRVFTSQPNPPYDAGDLWTGGSSGDLKRCIISRATGSYVVTDWELATKYTDDTVANNALNKASKNNINLLKNGGAELYTGVSGENIPDGWLVWAQSPSVTIRRRVKDQALTISGNASFEITAGNFVNTVGSYYQNYTNPAIGKTYTASCVMSAHRCTSRLKLVGLDSNGAVVQVSEASVTNEYTPQLLVVSVTTIVNTATIRIELVKDSTPGGEPDSFLFADNVKLEEGSEATPYIEVDLSSSDAIANSLSQLSDISNDSKLTPDEKVATKLKWDEIVSEKTNIDNQADTYGVTTEKSNYDNGYDILNAYITPLLTNMTTTDTISRNDFNNNFINYYNKKSVLLKAISDKAKQLADNAQQTADNSIQQNVEYNHFSVNSTDGAKVSHDDGSYTQMKGDGLNRNIPIPIYQENPTGIPNQETFDGKTIQILQSEGWEFGGGNDYTIESNMLRLGMGDNDNSYARVYKNITKDNAQFSFSYYMTNTGADYMFYIDGVQQTLNVSATPTTFSTTISKGLHSFQWIAAYDNNNYDEPDMYIDYVIFEQNPVSLQQIDQIIEGKHYNYITYIGIGHTVGNYSSYNDYDESFIPDTWVQLPEEFKGKNFNVLVAMQDTGAVSGYGNIHRIKTDVIQKDIVNARFKVRGVITRRYYDPDGTSDYVYTGLDFIYFVSY